MTEEAGECPICSKLFPVRELQAHANTCLDGTTQLSDQLQPGVSIRETFPRHSSSPPSSHLHNSSPGYLGYGGHSLQLSLPNGYPPATGASVSPRLVSPRGSFSGDASSLGFSGQYLSSTEPLIPNLPQGWEARKDPQGKWYYIDHVNKTTTYEDPRLSTVPLPANWETRRDTMGRAYYVDHDSRTTTYDDPRQIANHSAYSVPIAPFGGVAVPSPNIKQRFQHKPSDVLKEGWLGTGPSVTNSWVVLTRSQLLTYTDSQKEEMQLAGAVVENVTHAKFEVRHNTTVKIFTCYDPSELRKWASSINTAINSLKQSESVQQGWILLEENKAALKEKMPRSPQEAIAQMDQKWLKELKAHPEDEQVLVIGHLNMVLTLSTHRFGSHIPKFVESWTKKNRPKKGKAMPELTEKELEQICAEVNSFIANLISSLDSYYRGLQELGANIDYFCHSAIEDLLFPKINEDVWKMFRIQYKKKDEEYQAKLNSIRSVMPAHLGLPKLFWLLPTGEETENSVPPYSKAINTFQQISQQLTPTAKINCLVQVADAIVSGVKDYWKGKKQPGELVIGGDEFLPIFTFIVIKAAVPNLHTETQFMEQFISENTSISQGGYLLVTLHTALSFLSKLEPSELEKNAEEMIIKEEEREAKQRAKEESAALQVVDQPTEQRAPVAEEKTKKEEDLISFD